MLILTAQEVNLRLLAPVWKRIIYKFNILQIRLNSRGLFFVFRWMQSKKVEAKTKKVAIQKNKYKRKRKVISLWLLCASFDLMEVPSVLWTTHPQINRPVSCDLSHHWKHSFIFKAFVEWSFFFRKLRIFNILKFFLKIWRLRNETKSMHILRLK